MKKAHHKVHLRVIYNDKDNKRSTEMFLVHETATDKKFIVKTPFNTLTNLVKDEMKKVLTKFKDCKIVDLKLFWVHSNSEEHSFNYHIKPDTFEYLS